jgi:hypothetical protein
MSLIFDRRILVIFGIFLLDVWTPVGTPTWFLYFLPLLFMQSDLQRHFPLILAGTCTVFIFVAFLLSPQDATGSSTLTHRAILVMGIWLTALILDRRRDEPGG